MRQRKRAAIALLTAAVLGFGACDGAESPEDDPGGPAQEGGPAQDAPGQEVPEAEETDERENEED